VPHKFDPRFLLFHKKWGLTSTKYEDFKGWVPPPVNPPPMMDEEKNKAASKRLDNLPLCE